MHELEPRGNFIQQFYVHTMKDNDQSIATINKFIAEAKASNDAYENLLNLLGYKLMAIGDMEEQQKHSQTTLKLIPTDTTLMIQWGNITSKMK